MPIKSSIGQAHTCRHTQSLARIYQLNMKKEKWKFQRAASSRLKSKQPKNKKNQKKKKKKEPRAVVWNWDVWLLYSLTVFISSSSFYWFHFPILSCVVVFSWSCAFIHSSFIWIKNLTRSSTYKSQKTIDFSALFLCYWAVILFFLFHSIDLIKSDWEKEIPNCENTVWKIPKKTHRAQAKSSDLNMWSKPLEKWARQTCELNNKKNQNNQNNDS